MPCSMKPILFNGEMVRAIINGSKSQTRRVVPTDWIQSKKEPLLTHGVGGIWHFWSSGEHKSKYQINDILYVRETFRPFSNITSCTRDVGITYASDGESRVWFAEVEDMYSEFGPKWKPSIFLPKKFSRIFLKVKDVRLERLNEISEDDARSEGVKFVGCGRFQCYSNDEYAYPTAKQSFLSLWDLINKKRGFPSESNPWVFVYEFEKVEMRTLPYRVVEEGC